MHKYIRKPAEPFGHIHLSFLGGEQIDELLCAPRDHRLEVLQAGHAERPIPRLAAAQMLLRVPERDKGRYGLGGSPGSPLYTASGISIPQGRRASALWRRSTLTRTLVQASRSHQRVYGRGIAYRELVRACLPVSVVLGGAPVVIELTNSHNVAVASVQLLRVYVSLAAAGNPRQGEFGQLERDRSGVACEGVPWGETVQADGSC